MTKVAVFKEESTGKKGRVIESGIIFLYIILLIYQMPILRFNNHHIAGAVGWIYCLMNYGYLCKFIRKKEIMVVIAGMIGLFSYVLMESTANHTSQQICSFYLYWIIDIFPAICLLLIEMRYYKISIFRLIYYAAVLESLFSIMAFVFPCVKNSFIRIMLETGFYDESVLKISQAVRVYGFSGGLFFDMPILQCFLGVLCFYYSLNISLKYMFPCVLLWTSGIINARTGLIVICMGITIVLLDGIKRMNRRGLKRWAIELVSGIVLIFLVGIFFADNQTINWIRLSIVDIITLALGKIGGKTNTFTHLRDMIILPEGRALFFGAGFRTTGGAYGVSSDIGYINDLWTGGILYCLSKYILYTYILLCTRNGITKLRGRDFANLYFLLSFGSLFVCNIKGQVFGVNCLTIFFMIVFFVVSDLKDYDRYFISSGLL